ncbi:hypothetical protein LguiA_026387 [Lonicera macranthoides]
MSILAVKFLEEAEIWLIGSMGLGKLVTLAFYEIELIWGVKSELSRIESTLSTIKAVLLDAVDQKKNSQQVEDWLEKVEDVLYDIDDLLDDFIAEDKQQKLVVIKGSK